MEDAALMELIGIVATISESISAQLDYKNDTEYLPEVQTTGTDVRVMFASVRIWLDTLDDRNFDTAANDFEPMGPFLVRKMQEVQSRYAGLDIKPAVPF